jgi:Entner-Doudoroff aldolase
MDNNSRKVTMVNKNSDKVKEKISAVGLVPVVVIDDLDRTLDAAKALLDGGVPIMEITLRTPPGLDAIERVAAACPEILLGGGTVLNMDQCKAAIDKGASFIVSPGFDEELVEYCLKQDIAVFPGCVTPTEINAALKMGLTTVKFFPANVYGGVKAIKALSGPFPMMRFVPTGGVDLGNLAEYIIPQTAAVGGGWLCDRKALNSKDYPSITKACAASVEIVKKQKEALKD